MSATTATTRLHLVSHSSLPSSQLSSRPCFLLLPFAIPLFPFLAPAWPRPVSSSFIPYALLPGHKIEIVLTTTPRSVRPYGRGPSRLLSAARARPRPSSPPTTLRNAGGTASVAAGEAGPIDEMTDRDRNHQPSVRKPATPSILGRKKCLMIGPSARK